ncbi:MAG: Holliday junction resolvase RecU [Eubacterium sp.]|nr:Holliday junction resolvase RecU [Eubacterium sp.]
MCAWKTRGLRGSTLEELVNRTNERYRDMGLALIQKIPTPITPINMDKDSRHITLAYFDQKSTVDYIGAVQGIPICFDAKECQNDRFPLANVHEHQIRFMSDFEAQEGIAFLLIYYVHRDEMYYLCLKDLLYFLNRAENGGRKSFLYEELDPAYRIPVKHGVLIPYLDILQKDLERRQQEESEHTSGCP